MNYNVLTIAPFDKQLKRLVKKYPSLKTEIANLITELQTEPTKGTSLGNDCYKIRLAIASKGKGKSAGQE
jgi:mRNA-degrading endonuclease RelE of RelBE toxin-antitoxin system